MRDAPAVVIVTQLYPPDHGGAEVHSRRLALSLMGRGIRVVVVTLCPVAGIPGGWSADEFGIPLLRGRRWPEGLPRNVLFALQTAVFLVTRLRNFNCVHWTMTGLHATVGLPIARWMGFRNVVMFAGNGEADRLRNSLLGRAFLRMARRWAQRILVLNPEMADEVERLGIPRARIVMVSCEIDADVFSPPGAGRKNRIRRSLGLAAFDRCILFVGRFVSEKRLPDLLDAFALVVKTLPGTGLILVGDGPVKSRVEERIAELGLTRSVVLPGFLSSDAVRTYLWAADVFVLVSKSEGSPCALVEALAVGLPCVVSSIPATRHIIENDVQGILVEPGDPRAIAAAVIGLLENPTRRCRMGRKARELALTRYALAVTGKMYEELFGGLVAEHSATEARSAD